MPTKEDIVRALAQIVGPDGKTPLPISGVTIRDDKVFAAIVVDPAQAKAFEPMRLKAELAIKALSGVGAALVTLTAEGPALPPAAGHTHNHTPPRDAPIKSTNPIVGIKHIIAVASGKGGVGKSTTACNLAVALGKKGLKVGVLDADIFGPSLPRLFGLREKPKLAPDGRMLLPLQGSGIKVMSIGFMIEDETPVVWRGPMVISALTQMLREVAWGELDVLVVDMPPGTGDIQLTMAQNVPLAGVVIVSTPQDLALIDARRGIAMFRRVQVPILGIVENMSYFLCPHCGERSDIFAHAGARREATRLEVPFLGEIPLAMGIRETSDDGKPIVLSRPESPHAAAYMAIADQLWTTLSQGMTGAKPAPTIRMG